MAKMVDGKTIKELETRAKTALYANEYIIIVLNQEEENVHSYQRIRNICISLFKSAL